MSVKRNPGIKGRPSIFVILHKWNTSACAHSSRFNQYLVNLVTKRGKKLNNIKYNKQL